MPIGLTPEDVLNWGDLDGTQAIGETTLGEIVENMVIPAVEAGLAKTHTVPTEGDADGDLYLGAVMLCVRLVKRRMTPEGIAAFGGEVAVKVAREDPDICALLDPFLKVVFA